MGFDLADSLLQGKGDLTRQARPHRAGEQSWASLPKHRASTETDSQHTVHHTPFHSLRMHHPRAFSLASHLHSPLEEGRACWKLVSLLPAAVGSCKLRWLQRLCSGSRNTTVHRGSTGGHESGTERGLSNVSSHGITFSSLLHFVTEASQTCLCSQSLGDSRLPISDLPTELAGKQTEQEHHLPACRTHSPFKASPQIFCRREISMECREQVPTRTCSATGDANELLPGKQKLHTNHGPSRIQTSHAHVS